jgi:hypothetical protein
MEAPPLAKLCALLARLAARLIRRGVDCAVHSGPDWFAFVARRGLVPPDVARALLPGVRPAVAPPTGEERALMGHLAGGPLSGPQLAERMGLAHDGTSYKERVAAAQARGLIHCPRAGYQLTEFGRWAFEQEPR